MKKVIKTFFISLLLIPMLFVPIKNVQAKTINDLQNDLNVLKNKKQTNKNQQAQTQAQINAAKQKIKDAEVGIKKCDTDIANLQEEIEELNKKIAKKKEQIKELMAFFQISESENFYLSYIFGAKDFTDFIYRCSVVEQLVQRSDELTDEMNQLIIENKDKIKQMEQKQKELSQLTVKMQGLVSQLGSEMNTLVEGSLSIDDEIKSLETLIAYYKKVGCSSTQDINKCVSVPVDTAFAKPLKSGVVTSEFGYRYHPTQHVYKLHSGIDLGGNREGTPVLASTSGIVVALIYHSSCGGNQVYVNSIVNGKPYTMVYMHLLRYDVKIGDVVIKGKSIGQVGGGSGTPWDGCSTGAHLHFSIASGHYLGTGSSSYSSYSTYVKNLMNPRNLVNFPAYGTYW